MSYIICSLDQATIGSEINEHEMDRTCSTHRRDESFIKLLVGGNMNDRYGVFLLKCTKFRDVVLSHFKGEKRHINICPITTRYVAAYMAVLERYTVHIFYHTVHIQIKLWVR
jgi:hypothetical protein